MQYIADLRPDHATKRGMDTLANRVPGAHSSASALHSISIRDEKSRIAQEVELAVQQILQQQEAAEIPESLAPTSTE